MCAIHGGWWLCVVVFSSKSCKDGYDLLSCSNFWELGWKNSIIPLPWVGIVLSSWLPHGLKTFCTVEQRESCAGFVLCPPLAPEGSEVVSEAEEQALFGLHRCICEPSTALGRLAFRGRLAFSARPKGHVLLLLRMGNAAGNRRGMSEGVTHV